MKVLLPLLFLFATISPAVAREGTETRPHGVADWFEATRRNYVDAMNQITNYKRPPYIPIGVSLGSRDGHFMFGSEVSLVYQGVDQAVWAGGYIDGLYGAGRFCFSLGPEFGYWLLGIDGGYMGCATDGPFLNRWVGRIVLTTGVLGVYARIGTRDYRDAGVLLKIPWGWSVSGIPMR